MLAAILTTFALTLGFQQGGPMTAGSVSASATSGNRALVEAAFEAWRQGTGSPFDLLADDAAWTIAGGSMAAGVYDGREAFMRDVIRPFNARMRTPLSPTVRRIYADGDSVVVYFDAHGEARDGRQYANTYAWFLEMRDGRVVAAVAFFDSLAFNDLWTRVAPASPASGR